jgi:hypothetical protein
MRRTLIAVLGAALVCLPSWPLDGARMTATYGLDAFPVYSGSFDFRWEEVKVVGQTSQARFREMRDSIPAAEAFASVAARFGTPYPTSTLDVAMRELTRYDDHGAGAGGTQPLEMRGVLSPGREQLRRRGRDVHLRLAERHAGRGELGRSVRRNDLEELRWKRR